MRRHTRRSCIVVFILAALLAAAGCRRQQRPQLELIEEESPALAGVVHVADPATSVQLLKGFYNLEQNSWRWTAGSFSVMLRPPARAAERGALLRVKLAVPEVALQRLKSQTLKAAIDSLALAPETYTTPGEHTYVRDVPASTLGGSSVIVNFTVDKTVPPGGGDDRELGIIAISFALEPK